jgi:hypothetical protein
MYRRIKRLQQLAQASAHTETPPSPAPAVPSGDDLAAAHLLAAAFCEKVAYYVREVGLSRQEAIQHASTSQPDAASRVANLPATKVSWRDLDTVYHSDPAAALGRWKELRDLAREQLANGDIAASAGKPRTRSPWELAAFLAVREAVLGDGPPPDSRQLLLADTAARNYLLSLHWQEQLLSMIAFARVPGPRGTDREQDRRDRAQAIQHVRQNLALAEASFLRAQKALDDIRRKSPRVLVHRAGQVNVGHQQVNVSGHD